MSDSKSAETVGALQGIRVLDLTRVLAGPWAGQLLADFGADVIKIERPGRGDDTRSWGPPWLHDDGDAAYYLAANRNKRSMTVNLASNNGQDIVRRLAAESDILIENFHVGTMARFNLDYAKLRAENEGLIYCSISAYGQSGSRRHLPGYDAMMQASAGLMSITGEADEEGGSPQKVGVAISDIMTGMYAVSAVLAALTARATRGSGQHIDLALYDSQVAWLANQNMNYLVGHEVPQRHGSGHPNIVPYQSFAAADGHLMVAVGNDSQFKKCLRCLELDQLVDDPRFTTNEARVRHRGQLVELLANAFSQHSVQHWLERLNDAGVPAGPINTIAEVFEEEYAGERGLVRQLERDSGVRVPTVANPVHFSETPVRYERAPPTLGQHTQEILAGDLGMTESQITALAADGDI